jgi:hypothetical protein
MAKVEQIDRDAAAKALGYGTWEDATDYRNSGAEDRRAKHMAEAFAAHRATERARIFAAMREPDALERLVDDVIDAANIVCYGGYYEIDREAATNALDIALSAAADAMESKQE